MRAFTLLTEKEMHRLDQESPLLWVAYLKIRKHMNNRTGVTGMERKISYQWLAEALTRPASRGSKGQTVTREQARYLVKKLEQAGLIIRLSPRFSERLVLKHPLTVGGDKESKSGVRRDTLSPTKAVSSNRRSAITNKAFSRVIPRQETAETSPVQQVFEYWRQVHDHPDARLTPKARQAIEQALADGYTITACQTAIRGCRQSAFHQGQNPQGQRYDSLALIFRDVEHIEQFIRLAQPRVLPDHRFQSSSRTPPLRSRSAAARGMDWLTEAFEAQYGHQVPEGNPFMNHPPTPNDNPSPSHQNTSAAQTTHPVITAADPQRAPDTSSPDPLTPLDLNHNNHNRRY